MFAFWTREGITSRHVVVRKSHVTPSCGYTITWLEGEEGGLRKPMHIHGGLVEPLVVFFIQVVCRVYGCGYERWLNRWLVWNHPFRSSSAVSIFNYASSKSYIPREHLSPQQFQSLVTHCVVFHLFIYFSLLKSFLNPPFHHPLFSTWSQSQLEHFLKYLITKNSWSRSC
jgi:hypothetical protein